LVRTDSLVGVGVRMSDWHNPTPTNAFVLDYANGLDEFVGAVELRLKNVNPCLT
jgi:hypothetical protein